MSDSEGDFEMPDVLEAAIPIAKGVHKILKDQGAYEKIKNLLLRKAPQKVLILGASGAGKSSFLKSLKGLNPQIRTEDRTDEPVKVDGKIQDVIFHFIDTPGEDQHAVKRREAILDLYREESLGIVNVVSYGYHENTTKKSIALVGHNPSDTYLEERRRKEIEYLSGWTSLLAGRKGPAAWLITVITKADLWWTPESGGHVVDYYRNGPYFEALGEAKEITHSVRSYSSLNQLFYGKAAMSGYYTDTQRIKDRDSLIALLVGYSHDHPKK